MDTKIIVGIVAAIVIVGAAAGVVIATQAGNDDSSDHGYTTLSRTNELFPDHTCCVIIGKQTYLQNNPDTAVRFLAAYVNGVNYLNNALKDTKSDEYSKVMDVAKTQLADTGITEDEIAAALGNITYLYQDSTGDLSGLKADIYTLLGELTFDRTPDTNAIMETGKFVDDTYIKQIGSAAKGAETNVSVTVITGDVHQIALHLANELGYFSDMGINLNITYGANGGAVAKQVIMTGSDGTDFGLLGAPPATINTVNQKLIEDGVAGRFSIIARVNSEGSGLYIKESVLDDKDADIPARNGVAFYEKSGDTYTVSSANAKAWGGLIFATPGITSIQHVQLAGLVDSMGLKFELYDSSATLDSNTVYYKTNLATSDKVFSDVDVNAGIIWEPQFQRIITE